MSCFKKGTSCLKQRCGGDEKNGFCTIQQSVSVVWFYLAVFGPFPLESHPLTQTLIPEENKKMCVQRSEDICCGRQDVESCIITSGSLPSCPSSLAPAGCLSSWGLSSSVMVVSWSCSVVSVRLTKVISDCSRIPFSPAASWTNTHTRFIKGKKNEKNKTTTKMLFLRIIWQPAAVAWKNNNVLN